MKRARKACAAFLAATVTGLITALVNGDQPVSPEGWAALIGGSLGLGVLAGLATYQVRNAGSDIGPTGSSVRATPPDLR